MDILMPQLGETVTEGKLIAWQRAVGDVVARGDVLFEIESDKATMEVEATADGKLVAIRVNAGDTAAVGAIVAVLAEETAGDTDTIDDAVPAAANDPAHTVVGASSVAAAVPVTTPPVKRPFDPANSVTSPERNWGPAALPDGTRTTPLARQLAGAAGIDLQTIKGSGPQGCIVGKDVGDASQALPRHPPTPPSAASGANHQQIKELYSGVPFSEIELDGMRLTIARRLVESKQTIPHFYLVADVEIDKMLALRQSAKATQGPKLTVNDFVVKAFATALCQVPLANAIWAEDRILRFNRVDVCVAVAVPGGLMTPVLRGADAKSLPAIATEIRGLAERARARKLKPHDYQGGSSTISNLGMYGVKQFSAIISPPQSAILAVGAAERRLVETADGGMRFSTQMTVTLSCDHRVIDGAIGAELLAAFKKIIAEPAGLLN